MKKLFLILLVFLISGCSLPSDDNIKNSLENYFASYDHSSIKPNNRLKYFSYYLPSDVYEESYDDDYVVMKFGDSRILMNINVADLINVEYYKDAYPTREKFFDSSHLLYSCQGVFDDGSGGYINYSFDIYLYENDYLSSLKTDEMCFYAYGKKNDAVECSKHLLLIARSINMDKEAIVSQYSFKETIDYEKKQVSLFDHLIPTEGRLEDIVID